MINFEGMPKIRMRYKVLIGIMLFSVASCTDNFTSINTPEDRISAENMSAAQLGPAFAQAEFSGMNTAFQICQSLNADLYVQYFTSVADYFHTDNLEENKQWTSNCWEAYYSGVMPQIKLVLDFTTAHNMKLRNAAMKVWKVLVYQRITDYWGPIIYSHFGNNKLSVPYDSQESIYLDFFKTLDEAVMVLEENRGKKVFPEDDLIFDGDVDKWLRFANSLRLRCAIRIRYVEPDLAKKEAEKAVHAPGGVMMNNADNAMVSTSAYSDNPINSVVGFKEFVMSATMQSYLEGFKDPRLEVYFDLPDNADAGSRSPYRGLRNGLPNKDQVPQDQIISNNSMMGARWKRSSEFEPAGPPIKVMEVGEVYFLRAEGALLGWNMGGTVEQLYNEGIRMSIENYTDATGAEILDYINGESTPVALHGQFYDSPPVAENIVVKFNADGTEDQKLQQIMTQKWIALYPDGWEAWAELRRTGYPRLYPRIESFTEIPVDAMIDRLTFPVIEYDNNKEAVENAVKLLGGADNNLTRIWWDAKK